MSRKPKYAWDSSVFLAWLGEEAGAPLADIAAVVDDIDNDRAVLIVSVVTYSEVLQAKHTEEEMERFKAFLQRSNIVLQLVTVAVAEKAEEIRSKGVAEGRKIKTPDAQHLATAVLLKADVLHSLDDGMLNLDGSPIVDGLRIEKPVRYDGQREMFQ